MKPICDCFIPSMRGLAAVFLTCVLPLLTPANAETTNEMHFVIPGGQGGGWDLTARTVGQTLQESGLVRRVDYENISGNSGGVAMSKLVEGVNIESNTLMVN